jgi:hypothetical protein
LEVEQRQDLTYALVKQQELPNSPCSRGSLLLSFANLSCLHLIMLLAIVDMPVMSFFQPRAHTCTPALPNSPKPKVPRTKEKRVTFAPPKKQRIPRGDNHGLVSELHLLKVVASCLAPRCIRPKPSKPANAPQGPGEQASNDHWLPIKPTESELPRRARTEGSGNTQGKLSVLRDLALEPLRCPR